MAVRRSNFFNLILRSIAKRCVSKDGPHPEVPDPPPSFETRPSAAPQDEVGVA